MTWIRKQDQYSNEECTVALQDKQKKRGWYVDSGCSKHMTGDRDKFLTLRKERDGPVSFGNDDSTKIIGKGTVRFGNKNEKEENVLLVEYMKHNLLSVSQMCDQGHKVTFNSQKCEIRKEGSGKLVALLVGCIHTRDELPISHILVDRLTSVEDCFLISVGAECGK
jgi:hypothetical protein